MIEVKNLTRKYGDHVAVDNISFTIEEGHIYGFLGPNGAGKSTTMNIITGCLSATSGSVTVGGNDIVKKPLAAKKLIGYLPEIPPLYTDLTVKEYLRFVGMAKGIKKKELAPAVESVMKKTGVEDVASRLIKHLSKGYRQRVGIAQAILGDPKVIILDEPTVGLDPNQIIEIRSLIKSLKEDHTVILSSHILTEISEICDEIIIINSGKIVAFSTAEKLAADYNRGISFELVVSGSAEEAANALAEIDEITKIEIDDTVEDGDSRLFIHAEEDNGIRKKIAETLMKNSILTLSLNETKADLEDIYLTVTSDKGISDTEDFADTENDAEDGPFASQAPEEEPDAAEEEIPERKEEEITEKEGEEQ